MNRGPLTRDELRQQAVLDHLARHVDAITAFVAEVALCAAGVAGIGVILRALPRLIPSLFN